MRGPRPPVLRTAGGVKRALWLGTTLLVLGAPVAARAQAPPPPSARDRAAAAEAYDRGSAAFLARDYTGAAQLFETANRLAPAPAALIQAIRAHRLSGNTIRAATLALRLDAESLAREPTIQALLEQAGRESMRIDVSCEGCSVDLDGVLQDHPSFFVAAGTNHTVTATFGDVARTADVVGVAGERRRVELERPTAATEPRPSPRPAPPPAPARPTRHGLSPVVTVVAAGAALALTGVAVWSGLDALAGVDAYEAHPTQEGLDEGQSKELRTNLLIAGSAVLAAATVGIALFLTDWGGGTGERVGVALVPRSDGGTLVVAGEL